MKKTIFLALFLAAALARSASAQTVAPTTICNRVNISSSPASEVTANTPNVATSSHTWYVTVMNLDTSATLYCGQISAVSSSTGLPILPQSGATSPYNWFGWLMNPLQPWYCKTSGASATAAEVCLWQ